MKEPEYKVLKGFDGLKKGELVPLEELNAMGLTENDIAELVAEDRLELVVEAPLPPAPKPEKTSKKEEAVAGEIEVPKGDPNVKYKYRVLGVIPITDGQGQRQGEYRVGATYEFTEETGNIYVAHGLAEKLEEEL